MGLGEDLQHHVDGWNVKCTRSGVKRTRTWSLDPQEPTFVDRLGCVVGADTSNAPCVVNMRSVRKSGSAGQNTERVAELPSTPPSRATFEVIVVPDSPEETWDIPVPPRRTKLRRSHIKKADPISKPPQENASRVQPLTPDIVAAHSTGSGKSVLTPTSEGKHARLAPTESFAELAKAVNPRDFLRNVQKTVSDVNIEVKASGSSAPSRKSLSLSALKKAKLSLPATPATPVPEAAREKDDRFTWRGYQYGKSPKGKGPEITLTTGSGKPVSVFSASLEKVSSSLGDDNVPCAEIGSAERKRKILVPLRENQEVSFNPIENPISVPSSSTTATQIPGPTVANEDHSDEAGVISQEDKYDGCHPGFVPLSMFVSGSGIPLSVSSSAMKKARVILGDFDDGGEHNIGATNAPGKPFKSPLIHSPQKAGKLVSSSEIAFPASLAGGWVEEYTSPPRNSFGSPEIHTTHNLHPTAEETRKLVSANENSVPGGLSRGWVDGYTGPPRSSFKSPVVHAPHNPHPTAEELCKSVNANENAATGGLTGGWKEYVSPSGSSFRSPVIHTTHKLHPTAEACKFDPAHENAATGGLTGGWMEEYGSASGSSFRSPSIQTSHSWHPAAEEAFRLVPPNEDAAPMLTKGIERPSLAVGLENRDIRPDVRQPSSAIHESSSFRSEPVTDIQDCSTVPSTTRRIFSVSNEAIERAKILIANGQRKANAVANANESLVPGRRRYIMDTEVSAEQPNFQTGSGTPVIISREAMNSAKCLLSKGDKRVNRLAPVSNDDGSLWVSSQRTGTVSNDSSTRINSLLAEKMSGAFRLDDGQHLPDERGTVRSADGSGGAGSVDRMYPMPVRTPAGPFQSYREKTMLESGVPAFRNSNASLPMIFANRAPEASKMCYTDTHRTNRVTAKPMTAVGESQFSNPLLFKTPQTGTGSSAPGANPIRVQSGPKLLLPSLRRGESPLQRLVARDVRPRDLESEILSFSDIARVSSADLSEYHQFRPATGQYARQTVGSLEVWKLLLDVGAEPRLATKEWTANHFKWIVWKLASVESKCSRRTTEKLLTLENVIHELKSRYDTELNGHRSALRQITERDSSAARTMVLCVSAVRHFGDSHSMGAYGEQRDGKQETGGPCAKIELTDGWYPLNAILDGPLTRQLRRGKLKIGQKIRISGALLAGGSEGIPPWEAFRDVVLKLHLNGTYRARDKERLGFCRTPCMPVAFKCIKPDGGPVPFTYVGVKRVYPMLFIERSTDGTSIVRTARGEELASSQFDARRAKVLEDVLSKLEKTSESSSQENDEGHELFVRLESSVEPEFLMADMTAEQHRALSAYQAKRDKSKHAQFEQAVKKALQDADLESRDVKRLLKVRVMGLKRRGNVDSQGEMQEGMITIWDPIDDQQIREGSVYFVSGLKPDNRPGSHQNDHRIQLQSFSSSYWRHVPEGAYEKSFLFPYIHRAPVRLSHMNEKFVDREFDFAGMVIHVAEPFSNGTRTTQCVFMADGSAAKNSVQDTWDETQLLVVQVNTSSQTFMPIENSLDGSVIGYCNLKQLPKDHNLRIWVAEASELSFYSSKMTSRSMMHLQAAAGDVLNWKQSMSWEADELRSHVRSFLKC